jgi:hypothetical protein
MNRAGLVWLTAAVTFAVSCMGSVLLAHPNLEASFGAIDDHEPLSWLGSDGRTSPAEALSAYVGGTEVGLWPDASRFRPFYYAVRMGQALVFGDNVQLWYASVLVLYVVTCTIGGLVFALLVDRALALQEGLRSAVVFLGASLVGAAAWSGLSAWAGIVARLGPSESLGLLGLALTLLGMVQLSFHSSRWWWTLVLVGAYVSVWSKESFFGVAGGVALLMLYLYARDRRTADLLLGAVGLVPVLVLTPVLLGTSADIYGRPVGVGRLEVAVNSIFHVFGTYWAPAAAVLLLSGLAWAWTFRSVSRLAIVYVFGLIAWMILLLMADVYVQGGEYVHRRYWAVFDVAKMLMVLGSVTLGLAALRRSTGLFRWASVGVLALSLVALVRLGSATIQGWSAISQEAQTNRDATIAFSRDVSAFIELVGGGPAGVVVSHPVEYEPARAILQRLFFAMDPQAERFLLPTKYAQEDPTWNALTVMAQSGNPLWHVAPGVNLEKLAPVPCSFVNVDPFPLEECDGTRSVRIDARGM